MSPARPSSSCAFTRAFEKVTSVAAAVVDSYRRWQGNRDDAGRGRGGHLDDGDGIVGPWFTSPAATRCQSRQHDHRNETVFG